MVGLQKQAGLTHVSRALFDDVSRDTIMDQVTLSGGMAPEKACFLFYLFHVTEKAYFLFYLFHVTKVTDFVLIVWVWNV